MAEYTANAIQTVAAGQNVLLTDEPVRGTRCIVHRDGSGIVALRGITGQCRARYRATFGANVAVPTGQTVGAVSLAIAIDGEPIAPTTMTVTPAAVEEYFNISAAVFIDVPAGCCSSIAVENISTIPVNVQNANLIVERVA